MQDTQLAIDIVIGILGEHNNQTLPLIRLSQEGD
jgi:hypothetical protein